ncbi:MAG: signal peptidase I [Parcubacteria group bacterium CG08_land_8_20_14_0_20_48_21]|nr:MAG: signal peptidase I [Parcubacteria group bacterium CG2_30_48_51]PIS32914.1 MAG: signal peptidase I [Parcubacteria group bacterium CG08_land_8_20_14_0_20_48_21]PIW79576.1 MAG: signal peptidase I [Parcubacteria group bacterium CG_4_8_14_3_um_filter_48_16]PIY77845.1 MAG: signal peptidase I [Parcubacteria group bacterium CG_4_10_14_0_8_um_filter_48_154]PIZ77349.1 MAG: signal peptidase I [bacterium CG_4_10_14_0_2_um_filter_48_144]PJC39960.1 MAG: signal peptidase I [Parcubacteria group bacter
MDENFTREQQPSFIKSAKDFISELVSVVVIALCIIIPVRFFLIQPFYVKGASMEPNFFDHEYLIINEISYRLGEPKRGDIVVFRYPDDRRQFFIKRIIGLPNEQIAIREGKVWIAMRGSDDLSVLNEPYLSPGTIVNSPETKPLTLGPDEYFVMGDNRNQSMDSRIFGTVKKELLIGKTWIRGWPFDRITVFDPQEYNL